MPCSAQLQCLVLGLDQGLRGSGEDLKTFYFSLAHEPDWICRNAVGTAITGSDARRLGGDPTEEYYLCFKVWGMGDGNACDIAQTTHEAILCSHDALPEECVLRGGSPAPAGDMVCGVYIDDLLYISSGLPGQSCATDRPSTSQRRLPAVALRVVITWAAKLPL